MNRKAIKSTLKRKFNDWLESIKDENVKELVKNNTIITGGCIASMMLKEEINDFDIYFTNKETTKVVANYYVDMFNEKHKDNKNKCGYKHKAFVIDGALNISEQIKDAGEREWKTKMLEEIPEDRIKIIMRSDGVAVASSAKKIIEDADEINGDILSEIEEQSDNKEKYRPLFLSTNAITLSNKIQLIIRFYGNADEIHDNFDFIHCTNYWESINGELTTHKDALESLLSKNLRYHGSKYPLASIIRTRKFIKRGWHINAGQYLKMVFQLNEIDLTDIVALEEQLVGVDTIYFMQLISSLKEQIEKNEISLSGDYVSSIIDKIF